MFEFTWSLVSILFMDFISGMYSMQMNADHVNCFDIIDIYDTLKLFFVVNMFSKILN